MKYRILLSLAVFLIITVNSYGQQTDVQRSSDLQIINTNAKESADKSVSTELVQTVLLEDFEKAGEWSAFIPRDYGIAVAMRREGSPKELESDKNRYVLGVKVDFMKRDWSWVSIVPAKPIKIKGITKTLSVWIVGRNYKHTLVVVLQDYLDRIKYLRSERMIWVGWKQVNINIPDTIEQENFKITEDRGITFLGFRIEFEPDDMMGRPFYTYFDYLTADTDLFSESKQNPDDMLDNW